MNWKDREKYMNLNIIKDNIIDLSVDVDAIVNSANPFMSKGGGVCGAIHEAGGAEFTEYCIKQGGLRTGQCKITPGFNLPYQYVIHVLAPKYNKMSDPEYALYTSYSNVIELALDNNIKSIAFPLLGAGHHGYTEEMSINCAKKAFEKVTADIKIYIVKPKVNNL